MDRGDETGPLAGFPPRRGEEMAGKRTLFSSPRRGGVRWGGRGDGGLPALPEDGQGAMAAVGYYPVPRKASSAFYLLLHLILRNPFT